MSPDEIIQYQHARAAYDHARHVVQGRWIEAESFMMKDPITAYKYACFVLKSRWGEAEQYILQDLETAIYYASDVINGRWTELELILLKEVDYIYDYVREVIRERWIEAESLLFNSNRLCDYAIHIAKGKFVEAEPYIMKNPLWAKLYTEWKSKNLCTVE